MANLKSIRTSINSVKNTQQITKAMKMVSAAKLKKAQDNVAQCRPYAEKLTSIISKITKSEEISHPLLNKETASDSKDKILYLVVTSDRGLCGGFNSNLCKWAMKKIKKESVNYAEGYDIYFIGKKGAEYFTSRDEKALDINLNLDKEISFNYADDLAQEALGFFKEGNYAKIEIIYNEYISALVQEPRSEVILPLDLSGDESKESNEDAYSDPEIIYEPTAQVILESLIAKFFSVQVYRCLTESIASEHAARMTAMENATNNANDMIKSLTLTYNKLRQASITTELIEITSGAEALQN